MFGGIVMIITYDLLLLIFALFGVILTLSEHEYLVISGDIIVCFCFVVYLILFILWCSTEMKIEKKKLKEAEDEIKKLEIIKKFKKRQKENKDE